MDSYSTQEENIKVHLDRLAEDTLPMKEWKFWRDKIVFKEARAYRWQNANLGSRPKPNNLPGAKGKSSNVSLNSSLSSSSQATTSNRKKSQKHKW